MYVDTNYNLTVSGGPDIVGKQYFHWVLIVVEIAVDLVIIVGDVLLLFSYFTRKLLGQSTNILVFSIIMGDLMTALVTIPMDVLQKCVDYLSPYLCKSYFYFSKVSRTAISYSILMLAMERIMAASSKKSRLLSPGRCLFFTSMIWFFAVSYNIWSVVLYSTEHYTLNNDVSTPVALCFVSEPFLYLYEIFIILDFFVIFLTPFLGTLYLFVMFVVKNRQSYQRRRLYKPSTSILVFTFALFACSVTCHLPLETIQFALDHRAAKLRNIDAIIHKVMQMFSLSRGFWDLFIFGAFRRYVSRKEQTLSLMRNHKAKQHTLTLHVPHQSNSVSLLDSDQELSARNSHSSLDSKP